MLLVCVLLAHGMKASSEPSLAVDTSRRSLDARQGLVPEEYVLEDHAQKPLEPAAQHHAPSGLLDGTQLGIQAAEDDGTAGVAPQHGWFASLGPTMTASLTHTRVAADALWKMLIDTPTAKARTAALQIGESSIDLIFSSAFFDPELLHAMVPVTFSPERDDGDYVDPSKWDEMEEMFPTPLIQVNDEGQRAGDEQSTGLISQEVSPFLLLAPNLPATNTPNDVMLPLSFRDALAVSALAFALGVAIARAVASMK